MFMIQAVTVGRSVWFDLLTNDEQRSLSPGMPDTFNRKPDVLIVGGGILGLATAAACRQANLGSIVVIERERLGAGASGGAAALLVPTSHHADAPPHARLGYVSLAAWRELHATWPGGVGLLDLDWLTFKRKPFGELPDPPNVERLSESEIEELAPELAVFRPGALVRHEARVNPLRTVARIAAGLPCVATGVEARGVQIRSDQLVSVSTSAGQIEPSTVVFATGLAPVLDGLELRLPQTEVKGHMLATEPTTVRLPGTSDEYGTPIEDGRFISGGDFSEGDTTRVVRPEPIAKHWQDLVTGVPGLRQTRISHQWACFRPAHPDRLPVIDRVPGVSNAWLTSGHFRTGILMAAGTGRLLASWIASGQRPPEVEAFGAGRFVLR
jgi:glycine oxidase